MNIFDHGRRNEPYRDFFNILITFKNENDLLYKS